ncbi:MAG: metal-dependent hydrolase [Limnochordia bacterium]
MKITFLGHACFLIEGEGYSLVIDPFLRDNPQAARQPEELEVDAVLVTHGHSDHLGDALEIAGNSQTVIIAPFELAMYCERQGAQVHPMQIGGGYEFPFGYVKLTPAFHGSAVIGETIEYTGNPCGFIFKAEGKTVYHAGDTGLFGDMELIGSEGIDVACLPIGDNFVMGIEDAVRAVELLQPKKVIPMHYNTFDLIRQDPEEFARRVGPRAVVLEPGGQLEI